MGVRVENIDWKHLLFEFDGRINRGKFWAGIGVSWGVGLIFAIAIGIVVAVGSSVMVTIGFLLAIVLQVVLIWMGLAISIKRWHDRGKSGWWVLITLIPLIGPIWALVETGFLEGDPGDNQYGPNPLLV
jgi:uncharacterized membrane protein YhaH (DUF805 family)